MVQGKTARKPAPKPARSKITVRENKTSASQTDDQLPFDLQQVLLNIFQDACVAGQLAEVESNLQEVKGHLYNRDFAAAFGKESYLKAYAARWSPSRALGYAHVFRDIERHILESVPAPLHAGNLVDSSISRDTSKVYVAATSPTPEDDRRTVATVTADLARTTVAETTSSEQNSLISGSPEGGNDDGKLSDHVAHSNVQSTDNNHASTKASSAYKIACIGGGAGAEIVGLAGWLKASRSNNSPQAQTSVPKFPSAIEILCQDIADWDAVVQGLYDCCVVPPKLSKHASPAAIAANVAVQSSADFNVRFQRHDVLNLDTKTMRLLYSDTDLVTIMFTLNELYSASIPKAQRLLHNLTSCMKPGALLLVVDSPGSYSAVAINGAEKKYPMQWLLDHTLLPAAGIKGDAVSVTRWEKLVGDDSRWFRLQEGLNYPIDLENMRYQVHLYRRCGNST